MDFVLWYLDLHIPRQSEPITTKCIDFDSKARQYTFDTTLRDKICQ